ncbi:MAG: 3-dehydroquinate synthase, partial [Dongiaceae bacterium]
MPRIPIRTPPASYDVIVERGSLERAAEHIAPFAAGRKLILVTTDAVWRHQGPRLAGLEFARLMMPEGEEHKRLATLESLADQMLAAGADRSSVVVGFGGGVVNDVAGFLAAVYMRGVVVIQIPTTLLAQVDAAIGGKTGVNLAQGKN